MAPANNIHSRSHSLLLLQKLLNLRDGASPLTLLIDSLEQPAKPLLAEFISRAKVAKSKVIWLSFETLRKPRNVDILVKAASKDLEKVKTELLSHLPVFDPAAQKEKPQQRAVVIIDSLNALGSASPHTLAPFLSALLGSPAVSLVAPYHADVPVILPRSWNEYEPHPFTVLCHLATAILRLSSLRQEVARQRARDRSVVEPEWGLREGREGVIVGLCERRSGHGERKEEEEHEDGRLRGVVVDMELRRRSGRTVTEKFVLVPQKRGAGVAAPAAAITTFTPAKVMLLTDHKAFAPVVEGGDGAGGQDGEEAPESTFNLGLTEKQKRDREGIVLPYFDAQTDIGAGEGGRILYEMGREDDFDDEEDEI